MRKSMFVLSLVCLATKSFAGGDDLLVGTTGDYPPLTFITESGFVGKDINILNDFAKANHYKVRFIHSSWPTLSNDLRSGKFTMAIGGISTSLERSKSFYLSMPIESSSKVPLINCKFSSQFKNFAAIDRESVVVVENRGGTNQDFAISNIHHASILLVPGNFTALDLIANDSVGNKVMFTDDVEANYRHQTNSKYCPLDIPEKFASSAKVFLFSKTPEGQKLQKSFDNWWTNNRGNY